MKLRDNIYTYQVNLGKRTKKRGSFALLATGNNIRLHISTEYDIRNGIQETGSR